VATTPRRCWFRVRQPGLDPFLTVKTAARSQRSPIGGNWATLSLPGECQSLIFRNPKEWTDLRAATGATEGKLIFTKSDTIFCWGQEALIRSHFEDLVSISPYDLSQEIADIGNHLHIKGFLEEAICRALARGKPLLTRKTKTASYLISDRHHSDQSAFDAMHEIVGTTTGQIEGMLTRVDEDHPYPEKAHWAEAVRVSFDIIDGRAWLLLDPDVWIWPPRARKDAAAFLDERRGNRYNKTYNALIEAWLSVLLGNSERKAEINISAYEGGTVAETPSFSIGARTAYTRALA
jgi:hypothetical protein